MTTRSTPSTFILTSDFPTLRNDASNNGIITIHGGLTIAANGAINTFLDFTLGHNGAITRSMWFSSNPLNSAWYIGNSFVVTRTGTVSGSASPYTVAIFVWRTGSNTLRLQIIIPNPYSSTLTTDSGEVIQLLLHTFIPPFAS